MTTGGVMLYLCTRPKADFQNKEDAFAINQKSYELKISIMFTNAALNTSNWLQQEDHGSVATRPVPVQFSFGSRSLLVRSSFVSRCLFVSLSRTYRGPNEEQAKNERKSNECRSRCRRETIGNSTICHRHGWQNTLLQPQNSILPLTLLLPRQKAALSAPLRAFSWRIKPFPPILHIPPTAKAPQRL